MEDKEMLIDMRLIASTNNRLMMKNMRLVMLMKITAVMMLALFTVSHVVHAQGRISTPGKSNSRIPRMVSAKALDITGKGCGVGFNYMFDTTWVLNDLSTVLQYCENNSWKVDFHRPEFYGGQGTPVRPLLLICEQTGGLGRFFTKPDDLGSVFECYYKN